MADLTGSLEAEPQGTLTGTLDPSGSGVLSGTLVGAGEPGAAPVTFMHVQSTPSTEWSVPLPWKPAAFPLLEVDGRVEIPDFAELSATVAVLRFFAPTTGVVTFMKG